MNFDHILQLDRNFLRKLLLAEIIVVDQKKDLLNKMGRKKLRIDLHEKTDTIPESLSKYDLELSGNKLSLTYSYDTQKQRTGITNLLQDIRDQGLKLKDLKTEESTSSRCLHRLYSPNRVPQMQLRHCQFGHKGSRYQ